LICSVITFLLENLVRPGGGRGLGARAAEGSAAADRKGARAAVI
jgi:hypothetical protein